MHDLEIDNQISPEIIKKYKEKSEKSPKKPAKKLKKRKIIIICVIIATLIAIAAAIFFIFIFPNLKNTFEQTHVSKSNDTTPPKKYYSILTGEEIKDEAENHAPVYCIQVPNGMDVSYPRAHTGLHDAKIIFEAIAEAGITRFAAIYQNPENSVIGPIRSLRLYYLDWDIPFDCDIVHAGGSWEAVVAARNYRDLTENYNYMFRDYSTYIAPNNLMTTPSLLNQFNTDAGYGESDPTGFARIKPNKVPKAPKSADEGLVSVANLSFGYTPAYNLTYTYDPETNTYTRAYASGEPHTSYDCHTEAIKPATECVAKNLTPSVVIAMMVNQWTDTDGYHQRIETIGSGPVYIFQNGQAIEGSWEKSSREAQIVFKDLEGNEIPLTPGQTWLHALPNSTGSVSY